MIMKKDLLLVIDMQNVYEPGNEWGCENMPEATLNIKKLLDNENKKYDVIFTEYLPSENPKGVWEEYNIVNKNVNEDEYLNEIVEELKPYLEEYPLYSKSVYSSMKIDEVAKASEEANRLVVSGVVSECCVLSTVLDAIDMGYKIIYLKDACAGFTFETEKAVLKVFEGLIPLHIEVMTTEEYLQ